MTAVQCARCEEPVSFEDVSEGYYAVCLKHDEDLYTFETKESNPEEKTRLTTLAEQYESKGN